MVTPYASRKGKRAVRQADRRAGMGGWKKRRPSCNGVDRGCAHGQHHPARKRADVRLVLPHQRPSATSQGEKADDGSGDTDWCPLPPEDGAGAPSMYGEGGVTARVGRDITAFRKGRWQGLSGMQGNLHVPFLGGWVGAIPPGYPAEGARRMAFERSKACLIGGSQPQSAETARCGRCDNPEPLASSCHRCRD